ncbi:MAG: hypothetical protein H6696_07125 [Deferribacteres bacterium]|nr:hypothetical protein [candidate division KSB1 bacterium]MCB9501694.1 hypothetical protein [Deferribacteres bacterium]
MATQIQDVRKLLNEVRRELRSKPNIVATGVGYKIVNGKLTDEPALICSVSTKKAKKFLSTSEVIPASIQNIATDVYPTGVIHALDDPTKKFRPAPGGVSIGHVAITAGTLGCLVQKNGVHYILSNNHVLANSNDASIGDHIIQPGAADGGSYPDDRIAELSEFVTIQFQGSGGDDGGGGGSDCKVANSTASILNAFAVMLGSRTRLVATRDVPIQAGENLVDCAIAKPLSNDSVKNEILNIGKITGVAEGTLGLAVKKSGRTTGFTTGTILQIDVTVDVSYGTNKVATFVDQLMTGGGMSAGGDSGSAILNDKNELVGLLFAGSSNSTIFNRIQNVFTALDINIIP